MAIETITAIIHKEPSIKDVEIKVVGIKGGKCATLTKGLIAAVGGKHTSTPTCEMNEHDPVPNKIVSQQKAGTGGGGF